jgi:ABC-type dipeptide/oligopeptide/nickel transport system permease subunit
MLTSKTFFDKCNLCDSFFAFPMSILLLLVIGTVSLAITPIAAVIVFHDQMNEMKIISMLLDFC